MFEPSLVWQGEKRKEKERIKIGIKGIHFNSKFSFKEIYWSLWQVMSFFGKFYYCLIYKALQTCEW